MAERVLEREEEAGGSRPVVSLSRLAARGFWLGTAGLLALALALRLASLTREPLWLDEGYTLLFSRLPLPRLITVGGAHEHPPLYYLLVHLLLPLAPSPFLPRLLSAVFGTLSVLVLALLGRRLLGAPAGLLAALLLAVSPLHLWYSQNGRAYELAGLLVLLSYLALLRLLDAPSRSRQLLYLLVTAGCLYTEYTTLLVLLPQLLLLPAARQRGAHRLLLWSWAGAALLFLPWLGMLTRDAVSIAGNYWIPPPAPADLRNTALQFLGLLTPCPSPPCTGQLLPPLVPLTPLLGPLLLGGLLLLVLGVLRARASLLRLLLLWLLLPFGVILALLPLRSLYLDRVFLDATFPLYLLLAAGLTRTRGIGRGLLALAVGGMLLGSLATTRTLSAGLSNPDWRTTARDFQAAARPSQAVVFYPGVVKQLITAYLPPHWHLPREQSMWFLPYLDVPGWQSKFRGANNWVLRNYQLQRAAAGEDQIWLIAPSYTGLPYGRHWFTVHGFHLLVSEMYPGETRLELWDRNVPGTGARVIVPASGFSGWRTSGSASLNRGVATLSPQSTISRSFPVVSGRPYTALIGYRGEPPGRAQVTITVRDASGRVVGLFPRTKWYDWPVNGVWLQQPVGFVAPPGSVGATLTLRSDWGVSRWRDVVIYEER